MEEGNSQSDETRTAYLASDSEYLVYQYRLLLDILEEVKLGFAPREDLDAAIDNFIRFKLPTAYAVKLPTRESIEAKYRDPFMGEVFKVNASFHSETERRGKRAQIENEIKFNAILDLMGELKKLLEKEGIMNTFAPFESEGVGGPVKRR